MTNIERYIYDLVKSNLWLKQLIVQIYQRIFALVPKRKVISKSHITVREGYFFGFHDKSPWSHDNKFLLAHKFKINNRMPLVGETVTIGYFDGHNWDKFHAITDSKAWNWQTGSMLQWLGKRNELLFNDYDGEKYITRILSINGELLNPLNLPVAAISPDGKYAISHSFSRLRTGALAYGYPYSRNDQEKPVDENEYLILVNLAKKTEMNLFSLKDIYEIKPNETMLNSFHYFTHCLFAPSNERFVFYHRWVNHKKQVFTRMFSCNIDGSELFLFPAKGMVSHISWKNNEQILAYARTSDGDHYYVFTDKNGKVERLNSDLFTSDGHPQYSKNGEIITDTYPDKYRYQHLIYFDEITKNYIKLAKLKSPFKFVGNVRCDLHPRWDRTSKMISFDSAHTGTKSLCTMEVTK